MSPMVNVALALVCMVGLTRAACPCQTDSTLYDNQVEVNAQGWKPKVRHIIKNVYKNANQIINVLGVRYFTLQDM